MVGGIEMDKPIYILVRDGQVVGGPYRYEWVAKGNRWDGEEVIEVLPTDQKYEELKSQMV